MEVAAELYRISSRHLEVNVTDLIGFMTGLPHSVNALEVVVPNTEAGAVFYNVTLRGLSVPLQAYQMYLTCLQCKSTPPEGKWEVILGELKALSFLIFSRVIVISGRHRLKLNKNEIPYSL